MTERHDEYGRTYTCMSCEIVRMAKTMQWLTDPAASYSHTWLTNSIAELSEDEWRQLEAGAKVAMRLSQYIQDQHGA